MKSLRHFLGQIKRRVEAWRLRERYGRMVRRLRAKKGKIRVMFVESEVAKWKCQRLFEMMKASARFEPVMGVSVRDSWSKELELENGTKNPLSNSNSELELVCKYYEGMGNRCVVIWDEAKGVPIDLRTFGVDVVFLQQTWYEQLPGRAGHAAREIGKYALTCYVPYYVESYGEPKIDVMQPFHKALWRYFIQSEDWKREKLRGVDRREYAGEFVATGTPALARQTVCSTKFVVCSEENGSIIYAPHFSITVKGYDNYLHISTFLENGRAILAYAQAHPEQRWVFKPHPSLKNELARTRVWKASEIDEYWGAWRKLGTVCEDGNYQRLFAESRVMITDCASFLSEYGATGKPIIWLRSSEARVQPMAPHRKLYETYYQAHNADELAGWMKTVIEQGEDPRKDARQKALKEVGLLGVDGAKNILDYLTQELSPR